MMNAHNNILLMIPNNEARILTISSSDHGSKANIARDISND